MAEAFYTEEYLENKKFERLTAQRKYVKTGLRHLMKHIKEEEYMHPKQIQFIVRSILKIAFYFEEEALETYDNLPEDIKQKIEHYYSSHLDFTNADSKQASPNIIKAYVDKQEEINKTTREKAVDYIEKTKGLTEL